MYSSHRDLEAGVMPRGAVDEPADEAVPAGAPWRTASSPTWIESWKSAGDSGGGLDAHGTGGTGVSLVLDEAPEATDRTG